MKASSRTTGVIGGGILGSVGGPGGAIAGGMAGGLAMDGIITGAESGIRGEYTPYGHIDYGTRAYNGELGPGDYFDWAMTPVFDGLGGKAYARIYKSIRANWKTQRNLRGAIRQAVAKGEITVAEGESIKGLAKQLTRAAKDLNGKIKARKVKLSGGGPVVGSVVIDLEGNAHTGYSFRLREALGSEGFYGEVPSAQQILNKRLPGGAPKIRGMAGGEPSCAEIHALHKHHRARGMSATPSKTITMSYESGSKGISAASRCNNCAKIGRYVSMGEVPTDAINGTLIYSEEAALKASVNLLAPCACEADKRKRR